MNLLNQDNEFSDLLKYLELQIPKKSDKSIPKEQPLNKKDPKVVKLTQNLLKDSFEDLHSDVVSFKTSAGFDVGKFESLMRAKLVEDHKKMQSYDRPYISVTELISCLRQKYYTRMKYEINVERQYGFSYLYLINKVGNTVHSVIQDLYDHTETEKTVISEKFKVKGRVDGLRDRFLLEYKTIGENKFKGNYIENHYHQGVIYAYILNTEYGYNISTITIVYIIRNMKKIVPFDLPMNNKLAEELLNRSFVLRSSIDKNVVPDPIGSDEEQCTYCSYKKYCQEDGAQHNQSFKTKKVVLREKDKSKPAFLL